MAQLFFSYIQENDKTVKRVARSLEDARFLTSYYTRDNTAPGGDYAAWIEHEIREAEAVLVFLCPLTLTSRSSQVNREIVRAAELKKKFLPILLNAATVADVEQHQPGWRFLIAAAHYYPYRPGKLATLRSDVEKRLREQRGGPTAPPAPDRDPPRPGEPMDRLDEAGAIRLFPGEKVRVVRSDLQPLDFPLDLPRVRDLPPARTLDQAMAWKVVHFEAEKLCRLFFQVYAHVFACLRGDRPEDLKLALEQSLDHFDDAAEEFYRSIKKLAPSFHRIPHLSYLMQLPTCIGAIKRSLLLGEADWAADQKAVQYLTDCVRKWILGALRMADEKLLDHLNGRGEP